MSVAQTTKQRHATGHARRRAQGGGGHGWVHRAEAGGNMPDTGVGGTGRYSHGVDAAHDALSVTGSVIVASAAIAIAMLPLATPASAAGHLDGDARRAERRHHDRIRRERDRHTGWGGRFRPGCLRAVRDPDHFEQPDRRTCDLQCGGDDTASRVARGRSAHAEHLLHLRVAGNRGRRRRHLRQRSGHVLHDGVAHRPGHAHQSRPTTRRRTGSSANARAIPPA